MAWCNAPFLQPNMSKDMIIDFRKSPPRTLPVVMKGAAVDHVESYLGVVLGSKMCFKSHVDASSEKSTAKTILLK